MKKNSEIPEDDQKDGEEQLQKITDEYVKKIDEAVAAKTAEIMEIWLWIPKSRNLKFYPVT